MSGLGHFIEREGLPTAGISLVREHTEAARPPRAMFVPFDFGRPFGTPGNPELQHRVLADLLQLFERDSGPVFDEFPDDGGDGYEGEFQATWSCPLPLPHDPQTNEESSLETQVQVELRALLPWYEHAVSQRGRTTVGASGIEIPDLVPFVAGFQSAPLPENPNASLPLALVLKAAVEDLKQIYLESVSARPDASTATHKQMNDWFWRETHAAELLRSVAAAAQETGDATLDMVAAMLLLPAEQRR